MIEKVKISKKVFNEVYLPYIDNEDRLLIFYGGAGSGKSVFVVQRYIYKILNNKLCNILVVRKTGDTNRTSTFSLFNQIINNWNMNDIFKVNKSDMSITCKPNGNQIIFKGLDNVEKIKSVTFASGELTDVWMEEASEDEENDYKQLNVRLRGGKSKKQIVMSLNPIDINHWIKQDLIDTGKATYLHTTYKDNRFIDDDYKRELESYKDTDPYYYNVYCLGQWGTLGESVFDVNVVNAQLAKRIQPIKVGYFSYLWNGLKITHIKWIDDPTGYIKIYKDVKDGIPYVIGGDTAGDGSDSFTAHVIDNTNGEQVCVMKNTFDEDLYARQMYCLGKYYNDALIGIEDNYSSYPNKELDRIGYINLYVRERQDTYSYKLVKVFGFKTTQATRPVIIANLIKIVREEGEKIVDKGTLEEMLSFVRNEKGRAEAALGAHDDLVMGLAIAYQIRTQQSMVIDARYRQKKHYNFEFEKPKQTTISSDIGENIEVI
ncbi:PBSX family phage terminase large subunit [Anaerofustis stercorihominis]|uniref:PBSX family phage terminase large subunit n=1 Tax=Anaerofustis stercorihominis TaxID=214853 RepID=A0A3E3DX31_9FIRM|nr:PBSX family phage terminase large subunit [Anaerofustis stercorihominis]RGD73824.1 PBSX family phage terminase large subunit [Anaerofustis stercorihominis]